MLSPETREESYHTPVSVAVTDSLQIALPRTSGAVGKREAIEASTRRKSSQLSQNPVYVQ